MPALIDLRKEFGYLGAQGIHAVDVEAEELRATLGRLGFRVYTIEGSAIADKATLFAEMARALDLPALEHSWDELVERFGEIALREERRVALVWKDADRTFSADAQILMEAVCTLRGLALRLAAYAPAEREPVQMEVFLLGHGSGFRGRAELQ